MTLTRFDLFEAAETGDVAVFERFFAEPKALDAAIAVEAAITKTAIVKTSRGTTNLRLIPRRAWIYLHEHRDNLISRAINCSQFGVVQWLFDSPISLVFPRTLQFFLKNAASAAVRMRELDMLEFLLSSKACTTFPEAARPDLLSRLVTETIMTCDERVLALLLAYGADIGGHSRSQLVPVDHAASWDSTGDLVRYMHKEGSVVCGASCALIRAAECGFKEFVATLIDLGADPRETDDYLQRPLHKAAAKGRHEVVRVLLQFACVDIDAPNENGDTPLIYAVTADPFVDDEGNVVDNNDDDSISP